MLERTNITILEKRIINESEAEYLIGGPGENGTMYCIDVFPGIQVIYNDFHCIEAPATPSINPCFIEINHCLRGKFECLYKKKYYGYLCEGDLGISVWGTERKGESFPLGYYEGVEILVDVEQARKNPLFSMFHLDLDRLREKLAFNDDLCIMRSSSKIQHICLEMYEVEKEMRIDYLRIKVLELLLFLSHSDFKMRLNEKRYYPRRQIEAMKQMKADLMEHLSEKPDFEQIAKKYQMNIHTLRKAFKEIYGIPLYQWYKEYRLEYSMKLLRETELPVIEIANLVGYSNPSKYSAAFLQHIGMTPLQYRKEQRK